MLGGAERQVNDGGGGMWLIKAEPYQTPGSVDSITGICDRATDWVTSVYPIRVHGLIALTDLSGTELWFATNVAIVGFNTYAQIVGADGEILPF